MLKWLLTTYKMVEAEYDIHPFSPRVETTYKAKYDVLRGYLLTGNFPNDFMKNQRDCLRMKILLKDGLLCHQDKKTSSGT